MITRDYFFSQNSFVFEANILSLGSTGDGYSIYRLRNEEVIVSKAGIMDNGFSTKLNGIAIFIPFELCQPFVSGSTIPAAKGYQYTLCPCCNINFVTPKDNF